MPFSLQSLKNSIAFYRSKLLLYIQSLQSHPSLEFIDKQHHIKLSQKLFPALNYILLLLTLVFATQLCTIAFAFLYPAYLTLETYQQPSEEKENQMLTYWVCFAVLEVVTPWMEYVVGGWLWFGVKMALVWVLLRGGTLNKKVQTYILFPLVKERKEIKPTLNPNHNPKED